MTYFELAAGFIDEIRDSELGGMAHGGEFETSLMMHLHPDLVGDDMPAEYWDEPYDLGGKDLLEGGPLAVYRGFEEYSATGAIGDPSLASAEKGRVILERLAEELAGFFNEVSERNC
jgi:creatinine amidohydrolase